MEKTAPAFAKTGEPKNGPQRRKSDPPKAPDTLPASEVSRYFRDWLFDGQFQQHSPRTIEFRQATGEKLVWLLNRQGATHCGTAELRQFLAHVANGHAEPGGRWGNEANNQAVRASTIHRYYRELRTFFRWLVKEELIATSPMEKISAPQLRVEQIRPLSNDQIEALLAAARRSTHPRRDEAIILMLVDTGLRASELCGLRLTDVDLKERRATVQGKGNKRRTVYFGRTVYKALFQHLREKTCEEATYLFTSDRGTRVGEPLNRSGLLQLIHRLGAAAKIQAARCSPHTFRHTFAVEFLRNGGNVFTLKEMLGHTGLQMTNRYVALAQADIENQHRQFSPADRLGGRHN